jgi:hypothetical protein
MRKGEFKILRPDGSFVVDGHMTQFFGVYKCDMDGKSWYAVTHRPTGKLVTSFIKRKTALAYMAHMEESPPVPWSSADVSENAGFAKKLATKAGDLAEIKQEVQKLPTMFG